jgi:fatty acid desaturase
MKANDLLEPEEIRAFTARSDFAGARAIFTSWAMIIGSFVLVAWKPNVLTFAIAVIIIGGRQLALAVLMHEAAHRTLFHTRILNDVVTDWLCARPVWVDVARYREHHLAHHAHAGSDRDPDRSLVEPFPTTRASLARKFLRDLLFVSGLKRALGLVLMDAERMTYAVSGDVKWLPKRTFTSHLGAFIRNAGPAFLMNCVIFVALYVGHHPWVYATWVVAWFTTYGLFIRIRSMAEHACLEGGRDPLRNTRTTRAGLLARLTVAPHEVGFHLEHHLLPTVPYFRLRALHGRLREHLPDDALAPSYLAVLRTVSSR